MAVPARLARDAVALHRPVAREDVLEGARLDVVHAGAAVRRGRALVEAEQRPVGARLEAAVEDVALAPALQDALLHRGEVGLLLDGLAGAPGFLLLVPGGANRSGGIRRAGGPLLHSPPMAERTASPRSPGKRLMRPCASSWRRSARSCRRRPPSWKPTPPTSRGRSPAPTTTRRPAPRPSSANARCRWPATPARPSCRSSARWTRMDAGTYGLCINCGEPIDDRTPRGAAAGGGLPGLPPQGRTVPMTDAPEPGHRRGTSRQSTPPRAGPTPAAR